jgi:hypothetical protein
MNNTLIAYRKFAQTISTPGNYCVLDEKNKMVMGWLNKDRAESYLIFYPNGIVVTMDEFDFIKKLIN